MRALSLVAVAILAPVPAVAQYAVFAPGSLAGSETDKSAVVARATASLARPPGAIPELHTEGTLPGHGIRDISIVAKRDQGIVLDLALAWALTRDRRFLEQTQRYLLAWVEIYRMSFNPIDETGFDTLLLATDLVSDALAPAARTRIDAFWRRMAQGYLDAMEGSPKNAHTNWQSHRIKLATLCAYRVGDGRLIDRARAAYDRQLAVNLRPDGSTFDFEERDALHYVTYNLDPLMMAALAAKAHGENWLDRTSPAGASLRRSLDWFAIFARGEREHVEFAQSKIAFDRERATSGQKEYEPHRWSPASARRTFALAALLDPGYAALSKRLLQEHGAVAPGWWRFSPAPGEPPLR